MARDRLTLFRFRGEAPADEQLIPKFQALHWTADLVYVHVGQIALLRRLFGQKPVW